MADPGTYFRILREAREAEFALSRLAEQAVLDLLTDFVDDLAPVAAEAVAGGRPIPAEQTERLIRDLSDRLAEDLAELTREQVRRSAADMGEAHSEAVNALLRSDPLGGGVAVPFDGVAVRAASTVLSRDELAEAFVTIRDDVAEDANEILRESILRGREPDAGAFERRLRHYVVGADALPDRLLDDRRRIGIESLRELGLEPTRENVERIRREAATVSHRSIRITQTETANAVHESHVQHRAASPVVAGVEWFLSPRHPRFDVCDLLAEQDLYGLGDGVYPSGQVPSKPHPFCLCGTRSVLLPPEQWGEDVDLTGELRRDPSDVAAENELPPSQQEQIARAVEAGDRLVDVRLGRESVDVRTGGL